MTWSRILAKSKRTRGFEFTILLICFIVLFNMVSSAQSKMRMVNKANGNEKMDAYTKSTLKKHKKSERVNLLVLIDGSLTAEKENKLINIDCKVRSKTENIVTLNIQADKIEQLISFDFVIFVEIARPLGTEKKKD